ncbi:MAG: DegT/DnrJ/EryC1/StrS family aminotransferase, partial [Chloroflexi bacterium]|nr:DegT/DnrJ/EryC1/StrS family aminotransferase [Chloroflexota bacterium]
MMKVPITKPFFDDAEAKAVAEVLASGWVVQGPRVRAFEAAVAAFTGAKHARATTSCTTALHLGLRACGVGPGDEVIVPAYTFVASANAVEYTGAKTVFADVDLETNNLDLASLERAMTPRTRAIMPVHQFGLACDMDPIMDLARAHNLRVVEDAACALGCFYKGRHVGTFGDAGCLSFHPRKSINTGEGGMVLANDPALDRRVEILRDHGLAETDLVRHQKNVTLLPDAVDLGYNYRMTDIQGAVGVEQVKKLPAILER